MLPFGDRVAEAVDRKRSQLLVGLDPRVDLLPVELRGGAALRRGEPAAEAVERFCCAIVDAVAPYVVGVKAQIAFFEALGPAGVRVYEASATTPARPGCWWSRMRSGATSPPRPARTRPRSSSRATTGAARRRADRQPVPRPRLARAVPRRLPPRGRRRSSASSRRRTRAGPTCRTSSLSDGHPLWHQVARLVDELGQDIVGERGLSSVGAVVGATHPRAIGEARRLLPQAILLLPGVGAQGASGADVARAFTSGPASALVAASRSIIYAGRHGEDDWRGAAAAEAARLRAEIWAASGW